MVPFPPLTEPDSALTASEYDAMAVEYDRHNTTSGANHYYERPATMALLGEVSGKRVLEVGCGSGPLTEWLVHAGASVVACDVSTAMLEIARSRVGDSAELHHHDLAEPLTFLDDASVDVVVASLVFHYLHDWTLPNCTTEPASHSKPRSAPGACSQTLGSSTHSCSRPATISEMQDTRRRCSQMLTQPQPS